MSGPIVVGVDGSECANRALDWAVGEAVRRHRPIRLVHAVDPWPYRLPVFTPPQWRERAAIAGRRILDAAVERVHRRAPDLRITTRLATESTSGVLRAEAEHAFALVLGNRGHGGFTGMLLGSTGLRMASRASVPLIIVRGDSADRGEVVVGLDLTENEEAPLGHAFDTAAHDEAQVRIVHAWRTYSPYVGIVPDTGKIEADARKRMSAVADPWRAAYPRVEVIEELVKEHPVSALVHASRDARLLVTGAHDRAALRPGSVGHGVLHHAHCPVAVVPR